jgi:hypothetical protein
MHNPTGAPPLVRPQFTAASDRRSTVSSFNVGHPSSPSYFPLTSFYRPAMPTPNSMSPPPPSTAAQPVTPPQLPASLPPSATTTIRLTHRAGRASRLPMME